MLAALCLVIFASCNNETPSIFEYSNKDLGVMGQFVRWMHKIMGVGNYGWTVVVFTVLLKVFMLPLDIWQRYASRKSTLKMQQMQPIIEGIDKRYGANTQRANEEKQKLYKKQGFSMLSSCLPMIISMVIFFVMFAGLRNYSTYSNITNFKNLYNVYYDSYVTEVIGTDEDPTEYYEYYHNGHTTADGTEYKGYDWTIQNSDPKLKDEEKKMRSVVAGMTAVRQYAIENGSDVCTVANANALEKVKAEYEKNREKWLWIQNVWQPDTWADVMQPYSGKQFDGNGFSDTVKIDNLAGGENIYNDIRKAAIQDSGYGKDGSWNGLMILPFLSIGLSFLSIFISQRMERKNRKGEVVAQNQQQKTTNMMMMIMMPLMMAYFGFIYTGAFAIYMVVNYTLSIITTVSLRRPIEKFVAKRLSKEEEKKKSGKATYLR